MNDTEGSSLGPTFKDPPSNMKVCVDYRNDLSNEDKVIAIVFHPCDNSNRLRAEL